MYICSVPRSSIISISAFKNSSRICAFAARSEVWYSSSFLLNRKAVVYSTEKPLSAKALPTADIRQVLPLPTPPEIIVHFMRFSGNSTQYLLYRAYAFSSVSPRQYCMEAMRLSAKVKGGRLPRLRVLTSVRKSSFTHSHLPPSLTPVSPHTGQVNCGTMLKLCSFSHLSRFSSSALSCFSPALSGLPCERAKEVLSVSSRTCISRRAKSLSPRAVS